MYLFQCPYQRLTQLRNVCMCIVADAKLKWVLGQNWKLNFLLSWLQQMGSRVNCGKHYYKAGMCSCVLVPVAHMNTKAMQREGSLCIAKFFAWTKNWSMHLFLSDFVRMLFFIFIITLNIILEFCVFFVQVDLKSELLLWLVNFSSYRSVIVKDAPLWNFVPISERIYQYC